MKDKFKSVQPMFQDYKTPQDYINRGIIPISPMLAKEEGREDKLAEMMYSNRYIAEDKLDGVRATLHIYKDHIRVFSRRVSKKTGWLAENSDLVPHIRNISVPELDGTILDAELVMPSGEFKDIASTMNCNWEKALTRQEQMGRVEARVFDIIYYKDRDMQDTELYARKKALKRAVELLDSLYITEIGYFDKTRPVVVDTKMREELWEKKEAYPVFYNEVMKICGVDNCNALKSNIFFLSKKAYYEYYVMNGGEGIILKDKKGLYRQMRGREYTKVKKYTTKDVVITGYSPPTREYLGKHTTTWGYWEDTKTKNKYEIDFDTTVGMSIANDPSLDLEPITKYYYEDWIGTIRFSVSVTEEEFQTWKKINPKEIPNITKLNNMYYLEIGETSGMTEEERIFISNNKYELIGSVIEVKAHEVILKTGRLRHPRFMRHRYDKAREMCTMTDHLGE